MNTAISVTRTGAWEDTSTRAALVPIPPPVAGTRRSDAGGSPVRSAPPGRVSGPCAAVARPGGRLAGCPPTALRTDPGGRGRVVAPEPAELVQRARAGFAATAVTAVLTAAVVTGFLALAHLRAPEPLPAPEPPGNPAVAVPAVPGDAPGSR
ncbi:MULTISPECIES: hypothetical protein [Nocardia]|uniref:hypothetical protein n=1 Tax=Nocardia TaxID=1817 RepID=UPI0018955B39|nr:MULTISPECIES: hypothetical protein [Nocardia]MBF6348767.1 hypothetical protein [Nocardia flavorosea]